MVGDQNIAVIDGHIPLDRIALQVAEFAVGDAGAIHLVVKPLAQDGVIGLAHADVINDQITHHAGLFAANVDLRYRAKSAHRQPFDDTVRATNVKGNVFGTAFALTDDFAALLQDKAPPAIAG